MDGAHAGDHLKHRAICFINLSSGGRTLSAYGNAAAASGFSSDATVKCGMRCGLDTVACTSPGLDELETAVEVCEPFGEAGMPVRAPQHNALG